MYILSNYDTKRLFIILLCGTLAYLYCTYLHLIIKYKKMKIDKAFRLHIKYISFKIHVH